MILKDYCLHLIYLYTIQGKARYNLKLLIAFLKNQINDNRLEIDYFYEYMDLLSGLTKRDIEVIKLLYEMDGKGLLKTRYFDVNGFGNFSDSKKELYNSGLISLSSKGLLYPLPALDGGVRYSKTDYFDNFIRCIKLEDL